jgi:hypothetical protein
MTAYIPLFRSEVAKKGGSCRQKVRKYTLETAPVNAFPAPWGSRKGPTMRLGRVKKRLDRRGYLRDL